MDEGCVPANTLSSTSRTGERGLVTGARKPQSHYRASSTHERMRLFTEHADAVRVPTKRRQRPATASLKETT